MKLADMTITQFSEVLASNAPVPGGGSAAAVLGTVGTALSHMVCQLTVGREKYKENWDIVEKSMNALESIRVNFIDLIDRDTEAFMGVSAVFKMPKETDEDKAARAEAMEKALKQSTSVPFEIMLECLRGIELTEKLVGKTNQNAASDIGVAALSLKAAVQSAWLNVLINIGGLKDKEFAEKHRKEGEELLAKALPGADKVYNAIVASLV